MYMPPLGRSRATSSLRGPLLGWLALVVTVLVWAGFSLSIRAIGTSRLTSADVALIRFAVPTLVLLPFLRSRVASLRSQPKRHAAMVAIGAGLPFFLLAAAGGKLTSAAHVSALVAGTTPLSVALIGYVLFRNRIDPIRIPGLAVIVAGVFILTAGLHTIGTSFLQGGVLLLSASLLWGAYTLALRRVTLDPIACAILVTYPSFIAVLGLVVAGVLPSHLGTIDAMSALPFIVVQGLGVGLLSTLTYATAIRQLGALRCATIGALAPGLATLLAIPLLGERPSLLSAAGVLVVTIGVLLSNILPDREKPDVPESPESPRRPALGANCRV